MGEKKIICDARANCDEGLTFLLECFFFEPSLNPEMLLVLLTFCRRGNPAKLFVTINDLQLYSCVCASLMCLGVRWVGWEASSKKKKKSQPSRCSVSN